MASLFPFDLSGVDYANKWNYIRAGIEVAVSAGFSMARTARELRETGLTFGDHPYRELYRELSGYIKGLEYSTKLPFNVKPTPGLLPPSRYELSSDYGYIGNFILKDKETGAIFEHTGRFDTPDLLSRAEASDWLQKKGQKYEIEFDAEIVGFEYFGGMKSI